MLLVARGLSGDSVVKPRDIVRQLTNVVSCGEEVRKNDICWVGEIPVVAFAGALSLTL